MNKLAIVFPGQGSQSVGMLAALAEAFPLVRHTFEEASDALGYDLWRLAQEGPAEALNQTDRTQPAMLAAGVAVWRVWQEQGGATPALMAGHSLGEYSALVCAGSLDFADAVKLVEERGRRMQEAVPAGSGAMAAILGLDDEQVRSLCEQAAEGEVVAPVNFNSPGQVVIAGQSSAVERAIGLAKSAGAKRAIPLPVSVPSHCSLMQPAAEAFAETLARTTLATPRIPVIHNADVAAYDDPARIRDALVRQLYNPVRWVETIQAMAGQGIDHLVEAGPGKVLVGLNKRIDKGMQALPVFDPDSLAAALQA
ncbi:ACP S-malonyltransferase [Thiohalobacter sp. IOR34]|uniref:ACP S-malonyltransferase n=1 Tax=Thiohalobacter sp. IOR34 TaxID=3057176 RepID=UPI0025B14482|nr:ACP S-malonyltransferase [Thiohalobacter sp. IOR34]WJW74247.1 ACP S-malonyltransferase [Thiohalobacter sp. IOR34]